MKKTGELIPGHKIFNYISGFLIMGDLVASHHIVRGWLHNLHMVRKNPIALNAGVKVSITLKFTIR